MTVIKGDCLEGMSTLADESIDLIYLDPPFYTQKTHKQKNRDNSKEFFFEDTWDSLQDYLSFIRARLEQCRRILKGTGSIFLHCDKSASHHLRVLLDEVFGETNFQSEIVWSYKRWSNSKKGLLNAHQTIYFYSKTPDFKFNQIFTDYSPSTNVDQILQERERDANGKSVYKRNDHGEVLLGKEKKGVPLSDVWNIPYLNPKAKERTGYPTQKPILLLEQIIKLTTNEGDTVLDPFCGSGTTLVAAKLLNRKFIGFDISEDAVTLTENRLLQPIKTNSFLLEKGEESYMEKTDEEIAILKNLDAVPVQRNKGIDGFLRATYQEKPISVRIQKSNEDVTAAIAKLRKASKTKGCELMVFVRTTSAGQKHGSFDFQMTDFEENILVIDKYDLLVTEWLEKKNRESSNNLRSGSR